MIDFLTLTLWTLGGALVVSIALTIIGQCVIRLRREWLIDTRRHERD